MKAIGFSNIWISIAASAQALLSIYVYPAANNRLVILFVFFSTLFLYNFLRVIKLKSISPDMYSEQMKWVNKNLKWITVLMIIALTGSVALFFYLSLLQQFLLLLCGIIVLGYNLPIYGISLRNIPFAKSIFISGTWAIMTFIIPISVNGIQFPIQEFLMRFFFIYVVSIPFDIRDLKYDDLNMKTTPQLFGIKGAIFLGWILLITCFCISFDVYESKMALMYTISYALTGIALLFSLKARNDLFYSLIIDGMIIVQALVVFGYLYFDWL